MKQTDIHKIFLITGGGLAVVGAVLELIDIVYAPYLFSIGAAILIFIQLKNTLENKDAEVRQKRLYRNGLFASLMLAVAAYFMFNNSNSWVVAVLIYSLSTLFLSFRGNNK